MGGSNLPGIVGGSGGDAGDTPPTAAEWITFAVRLEQARRLHGWTLEAASYRLGYRAAALSTFERGVAVPRLSKLPRIATGLKTSVDWLLGRRP